MSTFKKSLLILVICLLATLSLRVFFTQNSKAKKRANHNRSVSSIIKEINQKTTPILNHVNSLIADRKFDSAIQILNETITHTRIDPRPYIILAALYAKLGDDNRAYETLEKATDADIDNNYVFREFLSRTAAQATAPDVISDERVRICTFKNNKKCAITYSFDDGFKSTYEWGLPVFDQFGYRATLNLISDRIGNNKLSGTWPQWQDAHRRGFEIGNHTMSHPVLRELPAQALENEVNKSFDIIAEKIGEPPLTFVFPFERHNFEERVVKKILERHIAIVDHKYIEPVYPHVFNPTFGGRHFSLETAKAMTDFAIQKNLWLIAQCHDVGLPLVGNYRPVSKEFLYQHLSYIKQRESEIWIDTFKNVYRYLFEKKNTEIVLKNVSTHGVAFEVKSPLDPKIFSVPLTVAINSQIENLKTARALQNGKLLEVTIDKNLIFINIEPINSTVNVEF